MSRHNDFIDGRWYYIKLVGHDAWFPSLSRDGGFGDMRIADSRLIPLPSEIPEMYGAPNTQLVYYVRSKWEYPLSKEKNNV